MMKIETIWMKPEIATIKRSSTKRVKSMKNRKIGESPHVRFP